MSEVAIIERASLSERGLSDPLEFVYQHIGDFSNEEKQDLFGVMLEYEDGSFENQCALLATYADQRGLTAFIEEHNKRADTERKRTIALDTANRMSQIGHLLRDHNLRMTSDFPALSKSYYFEALKADDPVAALEVAQRRVSEHKSDPSGKAAYTTRQFRRDLKPPEQEEPEEIEAEPENEVEPNTGDASSIETQINAEDLSGDDPAREVYAANAFDEEKPEIPLSRNCYDCKHCWKLTDHHRLGVVNIKGTEAIDIVLQAAPVWVCRKYNKIISVYTQSFQRAENTAAGCDFFAEKKEATDVEFSVQTVEERNRGREEESDSVPMSSDEIRAEILGGE